VLLPSGGRRSKSDGLLAAAFLAGTVLGACALLPIIFVGQGLCSPIPAPVRVAIWIVAGVAIVVANLVRGTCPLPQNRRQIPQSAIAPRSPRGAFRFGAALGTGLATYLPSCAPHLLVVSLVLLQPSVSATIAAAAGFGFGRACGLIIRSLVRDRARFETAFQRFVSSLRRGAGVGIVMALLAVTWRM
jgi:hypothetical protein